MALNHQPFDLIYFQERWCKEDWSPALNTKIYFTESTTPEAESIGWQPAHTMRPEAAQYWFEIAGVRVVQAHQLTHGDIRDSGLYVPGIESLANLDKILPQKWNAVYPEYPWKYDRWVIVLALEAVLP